MANVRWRGLAITKGKCLTLDEADLKMGVSRPEQPLGHLVLG